MNMKISALIAAALLVSATCAPQAFATNNAPATTKTPAAASQPNPRATPRIAPVEGTPKAALILRNQPSGTATNIGKVSPGDYLLVLGCMADYSWCEVRTGDQHGWLTGHYINIWLKDRRITMKEADKLGMVRIIAPR